jgi:hypothetical protein
MTQIKAPDLHLSPEAAAKLKPENATHNILRAGKLLPVVMMRGNDGQEIANPLHAFMVIVWNDKTKQYEAYQSTPGEVWPIRKKDEVPDFPPRSTQ